MIIRFFLTASLCAMAFPAAAQEWADKPRPKDDWASATIKALSPTAPKNWAAGTIVLAKFQGGANWYPAKVIETRGNLVTIEYSGGSKESLPSNLIFRLTWKRGSLIECKIASKLYTPMTITALGAGYAIDTVTNAGKPLKTSIRFCRMPARLRMSATTSQ